MVAFLMLFFLLLTAQNKENQQLLTHWKRKVFFQDKLYNDTNYIENGYSVFKSRKVFSLNESLPWWSLYQSQ